MAKEASNLGHNAYTAGIIGGEPGANQAGTTDIDKEWKMKRLLVEFIL